jgi:hypothetical protein
MNSQIEAMIPGSTFQIRLDSLLLFYLLCLFLQYTASIHCLASPFNFTLLTTFPPSSNFTLRPVSSSYAAYCALLQYTASIHCLEYHITL